MKQTLFVSDKYLNLGISDIVDKIIHYKLN